jgi:type IV secretion system protein VirD4
MRTFKAFLVAGVLIAVGLLVSGWHVRFAVVWPWLVTAGVVAAGLGVVELVRGNSARATVAAAGLVGLSVWFAGWVPEQTPGYHVWPFGLLIGGPMLLCMAVASVRRRSGSAGVVTRWSRRSRRNEGVASRWQILRVASRFAVRRKAVVLRPSVGGLPRLRRWLLPTTEFATAVARVGRLRVWSSVENVTLRIGGPRVGKTGELAGRILDAPGAVIATSTRTDLIEVTGPVRAQRGPVQVFNPSGVGGLASTITFDPLSGCGDPAVATTRAADLLSAVSAPSGDGGDREYWTAQGRRVLAALLHAAALGEASMRDVLAWVADPDAASTEVQRFLRRSPEPAYESDALQFLGTNERTRSSICATIMPALGWLTDATAAAAASSGSFDVARLLASTGTVYMLGAEDAQVAPLVTALTGHIAREARRIAGTLPSGRLDPPLTLALDEAALICPLPLDGWTADMGGRNVTIHIAAQSRAQLRQRWGDTGAAAILNNAATVLIFGGTRDSDDLAAYSTLTGERYEDVPTLHDDGGLRSVTPQRVPVLSAGQLAQLPAGRVVIIHRGMAPAVGKVQMAWKRRDVRKVRRQARYAELYRRWEPVRDRITSKLADAIDAAAVWLEPWLAKLSRSTDIPPEHTVRVEARTGADRGPRS